MKNEETQKEEKRLSTAMHLEVCQLQEKADALKKEIGIIKNTFMNDYPLENIKMEINVRKVCKVLNEKFNNELLIGGGDELSSDECLFKYDSEFVEGDNSIAFFNGDIYHIIHSSGDNANSFKETYDVAVKNLKEQLVGNSELLAVLKNF